MGFERVVVGALAPLESGRQRYKQWLDSGYAASMDYLKRDPNSRTSPQMIYPDARSVIILSISYYSPPPADPGPGFGKVAAYAVGQDYHVVIKAKLRALKARLQKSAGVEILAKPFTDDVALYEQALAARHGLGFSGKNRMVIGPQLSGSYYFVAELFTDLDLEPDQPYQGTCGNCFRCGSSCPTSAIIENEGVDSRLCISFLTIENKEEIPLALRPQLGRWVFGCDICQTVCPYNQRPKETPWTEFKPAAGVGHHLNLLDLLLIPDQVQFHKRLLASAVRRPKRRGLIRNALVVLGNSLRHDATIGETMRIESAIANFARRETDEMLVEHAIWALSQGKGKGRKSAEIPLLIKRIQSSAIKEKIESYV